ncbi:MAG TPA: hypothetical protein PLL36_00685 [Candidatus Hydrogenedentes bacterium]|nr:hypothetical protein [Candidatus Hydrogenedentota bacterium]
MMYRRAVVSTGGGKGRINTEHLLFFAVFLGLCFITVSAWPMGEETFGNKPLGDGNYTDWPGIMPLINDEHRVYSNWCNGNEYFYYLGDTETLNQFLALFAALESPAHEVTFRPGPGRAQSFHNDRPIPIDWQMHLVGGIVAQMIDFEGTADVWDMPPTLTVYLTEKGRIQLDKVTLPEKVTVLQMADLRDKYRKALQSDHPRMHADTVTKLAAEDNLNIENIPLIAGVLKDNDVYARICAVVSLGRFGALAKSALPELQEASRSEDHQVSACAKESIKKITNAPDLTDDIERFRKIEAHIDGLLKQARSGESARLEQKTSAETR